MKISMRPAAGSRPVSDQGAGAQSQGGIMVTSIILINAERNRINEVAEKLQDLEGISEVYSVSGNFDLVAIVRVKTNEDLADLVTKKMLTITGITKTETMLAFQAFSRHDLEAMFALGM
jgi:DNA-binding Lrp family transcriptional regulator